MATRRAASKPRPTAKKTVRTRKPPAGQKTALTVKTGQVPLTVPPEVRREFEAGLDQYMEEWTAALRRHLEELHSQLPAKPNGRHGSKKKK